jgi:hypothetical protein
MKLTKKDITIQKLTKSGAWMLSVANRDHRFAKIYFGCSLREARRLFFADLRAS